jgi:hypothetical protein
MESTSATSEAMDSAPPPRVVLARSPSANGRGGADGSSPFGGLPTSPGGAHVLSEEEVTIA